MERLINLPEKYEKMLDKIRNDRNEWVKSERNRGLNLEEYTTEDCLLSLVLDAIQKESDKIRGQNMAAQIAPGANRL